MPSNGGVDRETSKEDSWRSLEACRLFNHLRMSWVQETIVFESMRLHHIVISGTVKQHEVTDANYSDACSGPSPRCRSPQAT
jgi:hypothetical protein